MKFWIAPIAIGLVIGIAVLVFFPHPDGVHLHAMLLKRGGGVPAPPPSGLSINSTEKIAALAIGIVLALMPSASLKNIGGILATAGITSLLG